VATGADRADQPGSPVGGERPRSPTPSSSPRDSEGKPRPGAGRYRGVPPVVIVDAEGLPRMAPFLMDDRGPDRLVQTAHGQVPTRHPDRYASRAGSGGEGGRSKYVRLDDAPAVSRLQRDRQL